MDFLKKLSNKRKIKYGAVLAIFLALVISVVVLFNSVISVLSERFNWFFDMTDEQLYSASDEFVDAMKKINGNAELEIIFFDEEDTISADHSSVNYEAGLAYVHQTATDLSRKLDNVSVSYHSVDDYGFLDEFNGRGIISESNVIIRRTDLEGEPQFEIYNPSAFYVFDEDGSLFAYNGEVTLLEAAVRVSTDDDPTVYYTANHGESELTSAGTMHPLFYSFINSGFLVSPIDLTEAVYICECGAHYSPRYNFGITETTELEFVDGTTEYYVKKDFLCSCGADKVTITSSMLKVRDKLPQNARGVIINAPRADFVAKEIELLESYLSGYGSVMTFLAEDQKLVLPEFFEWLYVWGGIKVNHSQGFATQGISTKIEGYIPSNEATGAYFSDISTSIKPTFENAITLSLDPNKVAGESFIESGYNIDRTAISLVETPSNVFFNGKAGNHTLLAITKSDSMLANTENETVGDDLFTSYLVVSASGYTSQLTSVESGNTNSKILRSLITATTGVQTYSTNINFKVFNDYALDISRGTATTFMVLSLVLLPLTVAVLGFVVIFRRKRR